VARNAVTLVLGGAGVKGVAAIGALQSLDAHKVPVKRIVASGLSGYVAAHYALGRDVTHLSEELMTFFTRHNRYLWGVEQMTGVFQTRRRRIVGSFQYFLHERLFCRANLRRTSVLEWSTFEPQIRSAFGEATFADLKIPLAISAIDLVRRRLVTIDSGPLVPAIKAGLAFPGLFPPVTIDGQQLVSSTQCCDVPMESVTERDSPTLAIDFLDVSSRQRPGSLLEVIARTGEVRNAAIKEHLAENVDYVFCLEGMSRFRWGSYGHIPQMVALARKETDRHLRLVPRFQKRRPAAAKG